MTDLNFTDQRRAVLEQALDGVIAIDADGLVLEWNRQAERIFGWTRQEMLGQDMGEKIVPLAYRDRHRQGMKHHLRTGEGPILNERIEITGLHRDGTEFPVELTVIPVMIDGQRQFHSFIRDITEQKRNEKRLADANSELEKAVRKRTVELHHSDVILGQLPDAVLVTDLKGGITRWTGGSEKIFGYSQEEALGRPLAFLYPPEEAGTAAGEVLEKVLTAGRFLGELMLLRKDGTRFPVECTARLARDSAGHPDYLVGICKDITERRRLEQDRYHLLREQTARQEAERIAENYRTLAESLPQLAWVARPDGHIHWYNQRWYDYTGTVPAEMEGWGWQKVHDPDQLPEVLESWKLSIETGMPFEMEFPLRAADGRFRWFLTRVIPVRDEGGQILRWFGTNTDIDQQRRVRVTQSFLSEASALLFSSLDYNATLQAVAQLAVPRLAEWCTIDVLLESGPKTVAVAHPDPAMMARASELALGFPADWSATQGVPAVIRTGKSELYPSISDEMLIASAENEAHLRILRELKMQSALIVPLQAHGKVLGALSLVSTRPGRYYGPPDLEVAEELGRRAGLAIDNSTLFQQAQRAIQTRDEFLSIASHELKTPITSLRLQAQLHRRRLQKGDPGFLDPEVIKKLVDSTTRQTERLSQLVDDMLDISRIAHGKLSLQNAKVDLGQLVREVVERFEQQLHSAGCTLKMEIESSVHGLWDHYRLEQVVTNLLTNTLKYSAGKPVEITVQSQGEKAVLRVADQGMGIARENLDRIFQRFERAVSSASISGLGLGLYISRQIVEAHGGAIRAESELGKGATFTVELPRMA